MENQDKNHVVYSSLMRLYIYISLNPFKKRFHNEASFCVHPHEWNVLLVCFIWFLNVLLSWTWTCLDVAMCLNDTSLWIYNWSNWMPCCLILVFCFFFCDWLCTFKKIYFYNYSLNIFLKINKIFLIKHDVSLMGTGVCLKGTQMYPLSTAGLFEFNDVYLNWNAFVI